MFGILGGSSLFDSGLFEDWEKELIETPYGIVLAKKTSKAIFIQRHGEEFLPPHKINHRANIWALRTKDVERVFAINSTGSLKKNLKPGTFLIPHDFFCPWTIPTFFEKECRFSIPQMDTETMDIIYKVAKDSGMDVKKGGVYIQTSGPRFETVAEINFFKRVGDVVGMTLASEATLCIECGIPYASLCSIDNYCHGIAEKKLRIEEVEHFQRSNLLKIERFIKIILERVGV